MQFHVHVNYANIRFYIFQTSMLSTTDEIIKVLLHAILTPYYVIWLIPHTTETRPHDIQIPRFTKWLTKRMKKSSI